MWNLKRYKEICFYSEKIQKNSYNLLSICNSYLHIIKAHPFVLKKYKDIYLDRSLFFYIFLFFKNICEIKIKFFAQLIYKEKLNIKKKNIKF